MNFLSSNKKNKQTEQATAALKFYNLIHSLYARSMPLFPSFGCSGAAVTQSDVMLGHKTAVYFVCFFFFSPPILAWVFMFDYAHGLTILL